MHSYTKILTKKINITNNKFEVPNYFAVFATNLPFIIYGKYALSSSCSLSSLGVLAALPSTFLISRQPIVNNSLLEFSHTIRIRSRISYTVLVPFSNKRLFKISFPPPSILKLCCPLSFWTQHRGTVFT